MCKYCNNLFKYITIRMDIMDELKTLNDLLIYKCDAESCEITKQLRLAAIRDVHKFQAQDNLATPQQHSNNNAVINYIMWKNNLKEKDLT